jgi:hypothetical protein
VSIITYWQLGTVNSPAFSFFRISIYLQNNISTNIVECCQTV